MIFLILTWRLREEKGGKERERNTDGRDKRRSGPPAGAPAGSGRQPIPVPDQDQTCSILVHKTMLQPTVIHTSQSNLFYFHF